MGQIVYARPSGNTIIVNDTPETRQYAEENGWVEHTPKRPRRKAKAKPKSKE